MSGRVESNWRGFVLHAQDGDGHDLGMDLLDNYVQLGASDTGALLSRAEARAAGLWLLNAARLVEEAT